MVAIFSYNQFYARKDVSRMVGEARLTASTKTALSLNRHLSNTDIEVSVSHKTVTLQGAVGTEIQKNLAREVALSIKGVERVQNGLVVSRALTRTQPASERTLGERLDDLTIEAAVKTALILNENVNARKIGVSSKRGHVILTGKVTAPAEAELARKIAEDIEGVTFVEFRLALEAAAAEKKKKKKEGGDSVVQKVDDVRIVAHVRAAIMVNRNLDSSEIEIESKNGAVRLSGIVYSGAEKELAQKIAEDCWGVKTVANELRIRGAAISHDG